MRVDFYQLSRDPVETVTALLAAKVLSSGAALLVTAQDDDQLTAIGKTLWAESSEEFLANGRAGGDHDARQPILLSNTVNAANGAKIAVLADGIWREDATSMDRVLLLFGDTETQAARDLWRSIGDREGMERHIYKQDANGRWKKGG